MGLSKRERYTPVMWVGDTSQDTVIPNEACCLRTMCAPSPQAYDVPRDPVGAGPGALAGGGGGGAATPLRELLGNAHAYAREAARSADTSAFHPPYWKGLTRWEVAGIAERQVRFVAFADTHARHETRLLRGEEMRANQANIGLQMSEEHVALHPSRAKAGGAARAAAKQARRELELQTVPRREELVEYPYGVVKQTLARVPQKRADA